jgi:sigma-B regulation protein RsbU (phosphoserine phosphatase)
MPDESPKIPGWDVWLFTRPANDVGGDLVDYMPLDSSQYGLMLADVSGKGLGAALFMAKLQATIRALAPDYSSLGKLGEKLNLIFHRDSISNRFASLLYIQFSSKSLTIKIMNAGHFPPMIIKDQNVSELSKGDPALGLSPKSKYNEKEIDFEGVDLLLVYSDGLTEAQNETGEFFGDNRLKDLLKNYNNDSAIQIGKKILSEVDRFIGEANPTDDLSMIVLKRN